MYARDKHFGECTKNGVISPLFIMRDDWWQALFHRLIMEKCTNLHFQLGSCFAGLQCASIRHHVTNMDEFGHSMAAYTLRMAVIVYRSYSGISMDDILRRGLNYWSSSITYDFMLMTILKLFPELNKIIIMTDSGERPCSLCGSECHLMTKCCKRVLCLACRNHGVSMDSCCPACENSISEDEEFTLVQIVPRLMLDFNLIPETSVRLIDQFASSYIGRPLASNPTLLSVIKIQRIYRNLVLEPRKKAIYSLQRGLLLIRENQLVISIQRLARKKLRSLAISNQKTMELEIDRIIGQSAWSRIARLLRRFRSRMTIISPVFYEVSPPVLSALMIPVRQVTMEITTVEIYRTYMEIETTKVNVSSAKPDKSWTQKRSKRKSKKKRATEVAFFLEKTEEPVAEKTENLVAEEITDKPALVEDDSEHLRCEARNRLQEHLNFVEEQKRQQHENQQKLLFFEIEMRKAQEMRDFHAYSAECAHQQFLYYEQQYYALLSFNK